MRTAALAALLFLMPAQAQAQSGFVQGGLGLEVRRLSSAEDDRVFDAETSNLTAGAAGFLAPRFSGGLELDLGGTTTVSRTLSLSIAGRPTSVTTDFTSRRRSVSTLAGVHSSPDRRVRLAVYGGLSFTTFRREVASDAPPIVVSDSSEPSVFTDRTVGAAAGVDVAVRIGKFAAVVAGMRAHGLTLSGDLRGFVVRPFVAVRALF